MAGSREEGSELSPNPFLTSGDVPRGLGGHGGGRGPSLPIRQGMGLLAQNWIWGLCQFLPVFGRAGDTGVGGMRRPPPDPLLYPHTFPGCSKLSSAPKGQTYPCAGTDAGLCLALTFGARHRWLGHVRPLILHERGNTGTGSGKPSDSHPTLGASLSQRRGSKSFSGPGIKGHPGGGIAPHRSV